MHVTDTAVIVGGVEIVTEVEPDLLASSIDVAVRVSNPEGGTAAGALYSPELEIVPETADQVTAEL